MAKKRDVKAICILTIIITGLAALCNSAHAQLGQSQMDSLRALAAGQRSTPSVASDVERYATPAIYGDAKKSFPATDSTTKTSMAPSSCPTTDLATGLPLFGYEIFAGGKDLFEPELVALPPADYTLGPGDNIIVNLWGRAEAELNLTIDREGKIFIPKLGEIVVVGLTLDQLTKLLKNRFSEIYTDFELSIVLGKLRQIRVYVFGEVRQPGGYTVSSLATLLHALYRAGGINSRGSLRNVQLVRNSKPYGTYDLYDLLLKGDNSADVKLLSGDVIYVPVVGPRASISGEVRRPAVYELNPGETLADLLRLSGGATPTAFLRAVNIDRVGQEDNRLLHNIDISDSVALAQNNIFLYDGDRVSVPSIYDFHANMVQLSGHVKHPGTFGLVPAMRVLDLLDGGKQLREEAYTDRIDLYRVEADGRRSVMGLNLTRIMAGDTAENILLMPRDSLVVYSCQEVTRDKYVFIDGEVKRPGRYPLYHGMKLSDLIFLAGNFTKAAYLLQAEIARSDSGRSIELINANLERIVIDKDPAADIWLEEDDHVYIRQIPEWRPVRTIIVEGEVRFPGRYAIQKDEERLSEIIFRAGGLTEAAFPEGAVYFRRSVAKEVTRREMGQIIRNTAETILDSTGKPISAMAVEFNPATLNRIVIDMPRLLAHPGGPEDIIVADSDLVYIPHRPPGVQVIGATAFNGTIAYMPNKRLKYYIEQAGGFSPDADRSGVRVVKPNGQVLYGSRATSQKIALGDAIVVPSKLKQKTDWSKTVTAAATVVGSVATTLLVIDRLR